MSSAAELSIRLSMDAAAFMRSATDVTNTLKALGTTASAALTPASAAIIKMGTAGQTAATGLEPAARAFDHVTAAAKVAAPAIDHVGQSAGDLAPKMHAVASSSSAAWESFKGSALGNLAANALTQLASAATGSVTSMFSLAAEMQSSQAAFTSFLGGAKEADEFLRKLTDFAANTPFELRGLKEASQQLMNAKFSAAEVLPILNSVGNALSNSGKFNSESINGVVLALTQMANKGKISTQELNQLGTRGIPAMKLLAEGFHVTTGAMTKMVESGAVPAGKALEILVKGMNVYSDAMAQQAKMLGGAWSNLQDGMDRTLGQIGLKIAETFNLTGVLNVLSTSLTNLADNLKNGTLIEAFDHAFGPGAKAMIVGLGAAITVAMWPAIAGVASSLAAAAVAGWPLLAIAAAVAFAARPIIQNWNQIPSAFSAYFGLAESYVLEFYNEIVLKLRNAVAWFKWFAESAASVMAPVFHTVGGMLSKAAALLPESAQGALKETGRLFENFAGKAGAAIGTIPGMITSHVGKMRAGTAEMFGAMAFQAEDDMGRTVDVVKQFLDGIVGSVKGAAHDYGKDPLDLSRLGAGAAAMAGGVGKAAKEAQQHTEDIKKAFETVPRSLAAISTQYAAGAITDIQAAQRRVTVLSSAIADLTKQKVGVGDSRMKDLIGQLTAAAKAVDVLKERMAAAKEVGETIDMFKGIAEGIKKLGEIRRGYDEATAAQKNLDANKVLVEVTRDFAKGASQVAIFGREAFTADDKVRILTGGLGKLIDLDVDPLSAQVRDLRQQLEDTITPMMKLRDTSSEFSTKANDLKSGIEGIGRSLGADFANPLTNAIANVGLFATSIVTTITAIDTVGPAFGNMLAAADATIPKLGWLFDGMANTAAFVFSPGGAVLAGFAAVAVGAMAMANGVGGADAKMTEIYAGMVKKAQWTFQKIGDFMSAASDFGKFLTMKLSGMSDEFIDASLGAKTFTAALSNTVDLTNRTMMATGKLDEMIGNLTQTMKQGFGSALGSAMSTYLSTGSDFLKSLRDGVKGAVITGITDAIIQGGAIQAQFGADFKTLAARLSAKDYSGAQATIKDIGARLPDVVANLTNVLGPLAETIASAFPDMKSAKEQAEASAKALEAFKKAEEERKKAIEASAKDYATEITKVHGLMDAAADKGDFGLVDRLKTNLAKLTGVPALASGAMVNSPTIAMVGEGRYKEAVLPLSPSVLASLAAGITGAMPAPAYAGGGNISININYAGRGNTRQDADEMGRMIVDRIRKAGIKI